MKILLVGLFFLFSYSLASAQSVPIFVADSPADKNLDTLLKNTFLNKINIQSAGIEKAVQEMCNIITRKQSAANEKHIVFSIEVPPISGEPVYLKTKYLTAKKLISLFCYQNGLKCSISKGLIQIEPDTRSESYQKSVAKLMDIKVPATKLTAEYLPNALRDILTPHQLTFTIHNHQLKVNGKRQALALENIRISSFKHKATNLYTLLQALANQANLKVWMNNKGITFTQKNIDFKKLIRAEISSSP